MECFLEAFFFHLSIHIFSSSLIRQKLTLSFYFLKFLPLFLSFREIAHLKYCKESAVSYLSSFMLWFGKTDLDLLVPLETSSKEWTSIFLQPLLSKNGKASQALFPVNILEKAVKNISWIVNYIDRSRVILNALPHFIKICSLTQVCKESSVVLHPSFPIYQCPNGITSNRNWEMLATWCCEKRCGRGKKLKGNFKIFRPLFKWTIPMGSSAGHSENHHLGSERASAAAKYFLAPLIPLGILMCLKWGACLSTFLSQGHGQGIIMVLIANAAENELKIRRFNTPWLPTLRDICT